MTMRKAILGRWEGILRGRGFAACAAAAAAAALLASEAAAEVLRGGATLGVSSPVVRISREGNQLDGLAAGEVIHIFTEMGEPVAQVTVSKAFSEEVYSEPLPDAVARQIRESGAVLVFSNLAEYGDLIKAYIAGTKEAFSAFISRYPQSELRPEAQRVIDGIVYRPYKLRGTVEAYAEFLERNPGNAYAENARQRRDDLQFLPVRTADRLAGYRDFLADLPDNRHGPEARERLEALSAPFAEAPLHAVAGSPAAFVGRKVRVACRLQSVLPVYVSGDGVGRKLETFQSPRSISEHLNFQVREGDVVLWRLFASRSDEGLVRRIEALPKGAALTVYGEVFNARGNAPWIDVHDVVAR